MIDHLIWGVADLERGTEELAGRLGVRPAPGGRHPGRGTANSLISLGGSSYLEALGPDPGEPGHTGLAHGLDSLERSQLVGWAISTSDPVGDAAAMRGAGWDPGPVEEMEREERSGRVLSWRLTVGPEGEVPAVVPFLIDWGQSPHPSASAPKGIELEKLSLEHPQAEMVRAILRALSCPVEVSDAASPAIVAELRTPFGKLVLR